MHGPAVKTDVPGLVDIAVQYTHFRSETRWSTYRYPAGWLPRPAGKH